MSLSMKDLRSVIDDAMLLSEGRGDDLLKQSVESIKAKYADYMEQIGPIIRTTQKVWKKYKSSSEFQDFPNTWKTFLADVLKSNMLDSVSDEIGDQSLLKKAKYKDYKASQVFDYLSHLTGINYSKIQNYNPTNARTPIEDLRELEQEFVELSEENLIPKNGTEKVLIDFGKIAWYDLGKGSCGDEADAMGHCGNQPSEKPGDRVFSLRTKVDVDGKTYFKPHLTFIYNDGFLGEMKGRANEKPAERYHQYIFELLKLPIIEGVIGGGYEPEHNFELDDLPDHMLKELREIKGDEFIDLEGNQLLPLKKEMEKFKQGEGSPKKVVDIVDNILSDYYNGPDYEIHYDTEDGKFKVYNGLENAAPELSTIRDGYFDFFNAPEIDNYKGFMEDHFIGKIQDSVTLHIYNLYKEDIIDSMAIEEDEYDIEYVEDNLDEIIREVADDVKTALDRLNSDAYESGSMAELVDNVQSAVTDFTNELHFEDMKYYEFAEGKDFEVKNNDVYNYVDSLTRGSEPVEEEISDHFKVEQPYYGYMDFDESMLTDEVIEEAFRENDIELEYFKEKEE